MFCVQLSNFLMSSCTEMLDFCNFWSIFSFCDEKGSIQSRHRYASRQLRNAALKDSSINDVTTTDEGVTDFIVCPQSNVFINIVNMKLKVYKKIWL